MVRVIFRKDSLGRFSSISAQGHTEWSRSGTDIVCAAVSAILQAARLGLEEVARVRLNVTQHGGTMVLRWDENARDDPALHAILRSAELSLTQIAAQYPRHAFVRSEPHVTSTANVGMVVARQGGSMADTFKPTPADNYNSGSGTTYGSSMNTSYEPVDDSTKDVGRTLLVGLLGGVLSAAGFLVYKRLPEDQKERLHGQVRGMVQQRISEIRGNFNI